MLLLTLLAELQDFNIVISDQVQGKVALRLKNVPWDQAWDIIMETKEFRVSRIRQCAYGGFKNQNQCA